MSARGLRVRALLDDYRSVVTITLLVLVIAGGVFTYTAYAVHGTTAETTVTGTWESTGEFTHQATVVNGTAAFPEDTILRNRSVYFQRATPVLNGTFAYGYTASDGGDLTANATVVLVLRSISTGDENETEFWRVERRLGETRANSLSSGERLQVPFSTNVSAATVRATEIDDQLGASPGETEILILVRTSLSGNRNGKSVDRTRIYRLPITVDDGVYRVDDPGRVTESGSDREQVTVPATPGPFRRFGGPLLLIVGLVGVAGLTAARYRGDLDVSASEREWLAYRTDRAEFDDWITTARLPAERVNGTPIAVDSLEGLVDVAIDTDERVIEDRDRDRFVVLDDGVGYVYDPPAVPPTAGVSGGTIDTMEPVFTDDESRDTGHSGAWPTDGSDPDDGSAPAEADGADETTDRADGTANETDETVDESDSDTIIMD